MENKTDKTQLDRKVDETSIKAFDLWFNARLSKAGKTADPLRVLKSVLKEPLFKAVDILEVYKENHPATLGYSEKTKNALNALIDSPPDTKADNKKNN